ncbi:MAG: hypothetical protein ACFCBW_04010, partial [Candidatus Competibacterales bacterium]
GATAPVLRFWRRGDYWPVRLGITREATSGSYSVLVLKPLSPTGSELFRRLRPRFRTQLRLLLPDLWRDLDPALVAALAADPQGSRDDFPAAYLEVAAGFARGERPYESVIHALEPLVWQAAGRVPCPLTEAPWAVAVAKVLQRHPPQEVAARTHLRGRAAVFETLRWAIQHLLAHRSPQPPPSTRCRPWP